MGNSGLRGFPRIEIVSPFSPLSVPNCMNWYNAGTITGVADGGIVSTWSDGGNFSHPLTRSSNQPTLKYAGINGQPVVTFNGTNNYMQIATTWTGYLASLTCFFVISPTTTSMQGLWDTGPNNGNIWRNYNTGKAEWHSDQPTFNLSLPYAGPMVMEFVLTSVPSRVVNYYLNGNLISVNTNASTTGIYFTNNAFGAINLGSNWYSGDVAEIIYYNAGVAVSDRLSIEKYLGNKYAIGMGTSNV